jgi:hypothetical protein
MGNYLVKDPVIVSTIFSDEDLKLIQKYAMGLWSNSPNYDQSFGRHQWANTGEMNLFHQKLVELAREKFDSDTLVPAWNMLGIYEGEQAKLWKHKDDNACTYHIDFCIFQKQPWDLWVEHDGESKPYTLYENDGLFMYGNDQEHWRESFPDPDNNLVANGFFFFVEPDHWYFTKGPSYLSVIRGELTEEKWHEQNIS